MLRLLCCTACTFCRCRQAVCCCRSRQPQPATGQGCHSLPALLHCALQCQSCLTGLLRQPACCMPGTQQQRCPSPLVCVRCVCLSPTTYFCPCLARSGYPAHMAKLCSTMEAATATFSDAVPSPNCGMYTSLSHSCSCLLDRPVPCAVLRQTGLMACLFVEHVSCAHAAWQLSRRVLSPAAMQLAAGHLGPPATVSASRGLMDVPACTDEPDLADAAHRAALGVPSPHCQA